MEAHTLSLDLSTRYALFLGTLDNQPTNTDTLSVSLAVCRALTLNFLVAVVNTKNQDPLL